MGFTMPKEVKYFSDGYIFTVFYSYLFDFDFTSSTTAQWHTTKENIWKYFLKEREMHLWEKDVIFLPQTVETYELFLTVQFCLQTIA